MNADYADGRREGSGGAVQMEPGLYAEITGIIIGAAQRVHNTLGHGFLEKVYENALAIELRAAGFVVEQGLDIVVRYNGQVVGAYEADLFVGRKVIVEIKAISMITDVHEVQLLNYLRATEVEVGLLIIFGVSSRSNARSSVTTARKAFLCGNLRDLRPSASKRNPP